MDDDVGAELQRALEVRRGERVVDDEQRAGRVRGVGGAADVDQVQERVRRCLRPDELSALVEVGGEIRVELVGGDVRELVALRLVDLGGEPVDAAIDVRDQDRPVARVQQVHQRRRRADPGRECDPVLRALERREALLQRRAGRVRDARVVVALVPADRFLDVRRRLVDRRRHGAGGRIRLLPVVNRARLEVHRRDSRCRFPCPVETRRGRPPTRSF